MKLRIIKTIKSLPLTTYYLPLTVLILLTTYYLPLTASAATRPPAVAGQFYPADPQELKILVDKLLNAIPPQKIDGKPIGIVVPHAGYIFSAQTAAYAYKAVSGMKIDNIVLIGNSHNFFFDKGAVYPEGKFKTPLGEVEINSKLAAQILKNSRNLEINTRAHEKEHSLEVQLPFLQKLYTNFKIVPILLSNMPLSQSEEIGRSVATAVKVLGLEKTTLIIASSDMSHYPKYEDALAVDRATLEAVEKFDPETLRDEMKEFNSKNTENLACTLCGEDAVFSVMYAAKALDATNAKVLNYTNSGYISGDKSKVVGYGSTVFYIADKPVIPPKTIKETKGVQMTTEFKVSEKAQKELLKIARQSIKETLSKGKLPAFNITDSELNTPAAVFVTLTVHDNLRGCIGTTVAHLPLYQAVSQMAEAAAFEDTRFNQVTEKELKDIKIEISVLSPLTKVDPEDIIPNKHGVVVKKGYHSGLFLPQVWEQLPSKDGFMSELCSQKAGLEPDAWMKPDTEIYVFTVFAFEEENK